MGTEVATGHLEQFALEPCSSIFRKTEKRFRRFQLEDQPVENAALLRQIGRVVDLAGERKKLIVPAQAIKETAHAIGLLAALQETDFNRVPVGMRQESRTRCGQLITPEHEHARNANFPGQESAPCCFLERAHV